MSADTETTSLRAIEELPAFLPFFSDEEGFGAIYPELFAEGHPALMKIDAFGPLKLAAFRNDHLRRLMVHPALAGNTPPGILSAQGFDGVEPAPGKEEEARNFAKILAHYLDNQVFTMNPPLHRAYRHVIGRHLMGPGIQTFAPVMRKIVKARLEAVANTGAIDFQADVAGLCVAQFWGELLDMTEDEVKRAADLMHGVVPMFNLFMSHDDLALAGASMGEYMKIVSGAVERALAKGDNELINTIARDFAAVDLQGQTEFDRYTVGIPPTNVGMMVASNLFDGFHTAGAGAANAVRRLFMNPDALAQVRADRSLCANAVFEGLRLDPPLTLSQRFALEDFEFDGVLVRKGMQVAMLWGAGNRDPEAFPEPDRYDLTRSPRGATTFGGGVRMCMGRSIAQMYMEIVVEAVVEDGIDIELMPEKYALLPLSLMRQLEAMPVSITCTV